MYLKLCMDSFARGLAYYTVLPGPALGPEPNPKKWVWVGLGLQSQPKAQTFSWLSPFMRVGIGLQSEYLQKYSKPEVLAQSDRWVKITLQINLMSVQE